MKSNILKNINMLYIFSIIAVSFFLVSCGGGDGSTPNGNTKQSEIEIERYGPDGVSLTWRDGDQTGENPANGYYVYYGTVSGNLINYKDVGQVNSVTMGCDDYECTGSGRYYFQLVAYSSDQSLLSAFSEEKMIDI